jgi:hypothetical protein
MSDEIDLAKEMGNYEEVCLCEFDKSDLLEPELHPYHPSYDEYVPVSVPENLPKSEDVPDTLVKKPEETKSQVLTPKSENIPQAKPDVALDMPEDLPELVDSLASINSTVENNGVLPKKFYDYFHFFQFV